MNDRACEWGVFADRALVLPLPLPEKSFEHSLAGGALVLLAGSWETFPSQAVGAHSRLGERRTGRSILHDLDDLALRANQRLPAFAASFVRAGAPAQREERHASECQREADPGKETREQSCVHARMPSFLCGALVTRLKNQFWIGWKTGHVNGVSLQMEHLCFSLPSLKSVTIAPWHPGHLSS